MPTIHATGLQKSYGSSVALNNIDLNVAEGRILGLIGPNGAGKTTLLNAILGLTSFKGSLSVLGLDPWTQRDKLMNDVAFVADVAVLPRWMRVSDAIDFVAGIHPRFNRAKAEAFLARTTIKRTSKVRELSKGMVAQLHLALVMSIDARLLVLDEATSLLEYHSRGLQQYPVTNPLNLADWECLFSSEAPEAAISYCLSWREADSIRFPHRPFHHHSRHESALAIPELQA